MDSNKLIDLVAEKKQFRCYKVISRGKFSATIEVEQKDQRNKTSVLIMSKKESEIRAFDFEKMSNPYTVRAMQYEYICKLQTYLIYTETGVCSLQEKIDDKLFRKSHGAIESLFTWIKQISLGLKHLHSNSYVHLNISTNSIIITDDNRAKIGCFDWARHSSTVIDRFEAGSEFFYRAPETFPGNSCATDGKKIDTWCVVVLMIEALTKNKIAKQSKKIISWPQLYAVMYKVLQAHKFKKIVKKTYPKVTKTENLEKLLLLLKHTLKLSPEARPAISEFYILLSELACFNDIDKQLTEEKMWKKNVSYKDLESEMEYLAVEKKQSQALQSKKKEIDNVARTMGDTISDELQDRINEIAASPFEHKDVHQSEYFSSDIDISKSVKVALDKSNPNENINAKHGLRLNTDQERNFSKQKKAFIQHSEIFVPDLLSVNLESPKKQDGENSRETGEYLTKKKEEQTSSNFVIARNIFQKVINWTLDENFYTGVKHYGSYINQLSKALTG